MMPFRDWKAQVDTWRSQRMFREVAISARKRLEARGYVDLGIGSYWRWMDRGWFEKAKTLGVLSCRDGKWIPVAIGRRTTEVVGKHGREEITKLVEKLDYSKFDEFAQAYEQWDQQRNITTLIASQREYMPTMLDIE